MTEKQIEHLKRISVKAAAANKKKAMAKQIHENGRELERIRLIERDGNKCAVCNLLPEWNGKPLNLQIHNHGKSTARIICPNCHTQTDDYGGRLLKGTKRGPYKKRRTPEELKSVIKPGKYGGRPGREGWRENGAKEGLVFQTARSDELGDRSGNRF